MENILYITSDFKYQKSVKKFNSSVNKYKKIIIESSMNSGNAFFLNSLKCIGEVIVAFGEKEAMLAISQHRYSIIVFDLKIFFSAININFLERVDKICKKKILFIGFDGNFSKVLNITSLCEIISFNSIYVSNLLSDLSNYNLPSKLNDIIKPTYLGLGYLDISYDNKNKIFQNLPKLNEEKLKFDLFFSGSLGPSKKLRGIILEQIKIFNFNSNYNFKIISYDNKNKNSFVLNKTEFLRMIQSSRCCLDLSGASNNLTMRFNEILLFDGVPITDRSFKKYDLSKFYSEYINDICFENMDELNSILSKYQDNEYRNKTKVALKSIFESYYNPHKHGQEILLSLE